MGAQRTSARRVCCAVVRVSNALRAAPTIANSVGAPQQRLAVHGVHDRLPKPQKGEGEAPLEVAALVRGPHIWVRDDELLPLRKGLVGLETVVAEAPADGQDAVDPIDAPHRSHKPFGGDDACLLRGVRGFVVVAQRDDEAVGADKDSPRVARVGANDPNSVEGWLLLLLLLLITCCRGSAIDRGRRGDAEGIAARRGHARVGKKWALLGALAEGDAAGPHAVAATAHPSG